MSDGKFLELHSVYDADHPSDCEYAEAIEDSRRARHVAVHGDDLAYLPARTFPCAGALRAVDGTDIAVCDTCKFEVSLAKPAAGRAVATKEQW